MRRRLRPTREQSAKARSGGVIHIMMQGISVADRARKSAGVARIERVEIISVFASWEPLLDEAFLIFPASLLSVRYRQFMVN